MSRDRLKKKLALIRVNLTPPRWERLPPETQARLMAFVIVRQGGVGDVIATPVRLYAQMPDDLSASALRAEVAALVDLPPATCPTGCGADLALSNCRCDELETERVKKERWKRIETLLDQYRGDIRSAARDGK